MYKHAYLIIVHNEFYLLKQLIEVLDDYRNDIYIHLDKKVSNFDFAEMKSIVRKSHIYFVDRRKVFWGGDSVVKCEYILLKAAYSKGYQYYHLISGVDFPIKSQEYIHRFFDNNNGKNFLKITRDINGEFDTNTQRNTEYHVFQNIIGRKRENSFFYKIERRLIYLQRKLGINRLKKCPLIIYKGSQWFSITHELVHEIILNEKNVRKYFYKSYCPDELFINTISMNSHISDIVHDNYLRYIDWDRGRPYVFQLKDYDELIMSNALFARKFSCASKDGKELIKRLKEYITISENE